MNEKLSMLIAAARKNPDLKRRLFKSRESAEPVLELCRIATDEGIPLTIEELLGADRSTRTIYSRAVTAGLHIPLSFTMTRTRCYLRRYRYKIE